MGIREGAGLAPRLPACVPDTSTLRAQGVTPAPAVSRRARSRLLARRMLSGRPLTGFNVAGLSYRLVYFRADPQVSTGNPSAPRRLRVHPVPGSLPHWLEGRMRTQHAGAAECSSA